MWPLRAVLRGLAGVAPRGGAAAASSTAAVAATPASGRSFVGVSGAVAVAGRHRCLSSGLQAAPAVSALGLPEAVAFRASPPLPQQGSLLSAEAAAAQASSLTEVLEALKRHVQAAVAEAGEDGRVDMDRLLPLVERAHGFGQNASFQELANLAETFEACRLRLALRDLLPAVSSRLESGGEAEDIPDVVRMLRSYGRGALFCAELFDFCSARISLMQARDLAMYVYEAGRHGLRCRHYSDAAVSRAIEMVPQMSTTEIMQCWQGFIRFSRDRRDFYIAAQRRVQAEVSVLDTHQLLLALRASRDLRQMSEFIGLHAAVCTELIVKMDKLSIAEAANALGQCTFAPRYRAQAQGLVRTIEQKWSRTEDLSPLRVVEAVDALETFASWGLKPLPLVDRLDALLVERKVELQYTGNVTLWVNVVQSFARMEHADAKWPLAALELARDRHFVDRISFFQQSALAVSLGRLRLFDEQVFGHIADALVADIRLFKDVTDMAPVLMYYASSGFFHQQLFDGTYDLMLEWLEGESIDLNRKNTQLAVIQLTWSYVLAGFHKRYDSFAALLDYAFFMELGRDIKQPTVRKLAQLADAVTLEAPAAVQNCQYPEKLADAHRGDRARQLVAADPVGDPALLQEVRGTLQELGWPYHAYAWPDDASAFYIDISLEPKFGRKVGILLPGKFDLLRVGLPHEAHPPRESGPLTLAHRLHAARGWSTATLDRERWSKLTTLEDKRAFLERLVAEAPAP
mmetsp:Transcript_8143/g.22273  ORF Transcript_8143/g.22273 Transcript_8143/m.22273 type:complete len:744 (+) Transcript_8143:81-2312(+)